MDRRLYLFLLITLLVVTVSPHGIAQPTPVARPIIREIAFRGIEHFSPTLSDQLTKAVRTRVGESYLLAMVVADKQALLDLGYFAAVETVTVPVEGGIRLYFLVVENAPVISVEHNPPMAHATADQQQQVDALISTLTGQPFNKKMADAITEELLKQGIFYNAHYKKELVDGGIRLSYTVIENPAIAAIFLTGTGPLTEEQLRNVMVSKPGVLLNQNMVSDDAGAIRKAYANEGYTLAQVVELNMSPKAELTIKIFIPTISEIRIAGNVKTPEATLREQLTFKVGDYYNEKAIKESLAKIGKLPSVGEVKAIPEPEKENGTLSITINIRERN